MTTPKRHHYVPQMILKRFTDQDGWLHWYRCGDPVSAIRRARSSEVFLERDLYTTTSASGSKNPGTERALSRLETEATPILSRIICEAREGTCPELSADQKTIWYSFFLTQWRRTPDNQRAIISLEQGIEIFDSVVAEFYQALPDRREEIAALCEPQTKMRAIRNARIESLLESRDMVLGILKRRGIAILRIANAHKSFIVGSRPVVKLTPVGTTNLDDPSVEMWLTVSPDIAIGVGQGNEKITLLPPADDRQIRLLNSAIKRQSRIIASRSPALIRSIARARRSRSISGV